MRRRIIAAVLALAIGGCKPTPPAAPESERQQQAKVEAAGRAARAREAAALVGVTRAEAVESQAMAEVRALDVAVQAGEPPELAEVERRRAAQEEATRRREAAMQVHRSASDEVEAADRDRARYEKARDERLKGWRADMTKSGTRIVVAGGVLTLGGFVAGVLGIDEAIRRGDLAERAPGETADEHAAAVHRSNRRLAVECIVAVPLLAVGVVMAVIGGRMVRENRVKDPRVTLGGGGVAIRF